MSLDNAALSEMLAAAAQQQEKGSNRKKAMRRAARRALGWSVEAADLAAAARPLTELDGVGPWLAEVIGGWLRDGVEELPPVPPIRQGFLTWAQTQAILGAAGPEWRRAIRSDLQMHTLWSDGHSSIAEMAQRSLELGHSHILLTEHTKGLPIAHGLTESQLRDQRDEISAVQVTLGDRLRILQGVEMNLSPEGEGDMEESFLHSLDMVLGAFHSKLRLPEDQTERYVRALHNPTIDVLAHPRCRIFNHRLGLWADWATVFAAAAERGVAVECDCYRHRQDLDVELLRLAAQAGCWISIGTDSHHVVDLDAIEIGVATAVAAGVPRERILNCLAAEELGEWVQQRRSRMWR